VTLTAAGKIAFISERIEYAARPLATVDGQTTYGMAAEVLMGGKHIWARVKVSRYHVYPNDVIGYADRLRELVIQAVMDPEFTHQDVAVRDARWMFEAPIITPDPPT
jgi:hypothetical protein